MNLVEQILGELLRESVEQPKVIDAIKKHYEVLINYTADNEPNGRGQRVIQPTTLGISKKGNMVVRAFQPNGDTKTSVPHWKMFILDKIDKWIPLNRIFNEPQGFNKDGDKEMTQVLEIASFNGLSKDEIMRNINFSQKQKQERIDRRNRRQGLKGNQQSINDMSKSKDFGDKNFAQTIGPVKKGQTSNTLNYAQNNGNVNYKNAEENGPVYKGENNNEEEKEITNGSR